MVSGLSALVLGPDWPVAGCLIMCAVRTRTTNQKRWSTFMNLFIKTSTNPASVTNTNRTISNPSNPPNTQALEKAVKYFKGQEGRNTAWHARFYFRFNFPLKLSPKRERRLLTVGKEMSWAEQVKEHSYSRPLKKKKTF